MRKQYIVGGDVGNVSSASQASVQSREYNPIVRKQVVAVPQTSVPAGATVEIKGDVNTVLKLKKFSVSSDCASSFNIKDIKIGSSSQFRSTSGSVPAKNFSEIVQDNWIDFDEVNPGVGFLIIVENTTDEAVAFKASFNALTLN